MKSSITFAVVFFSCAAVLLLASCASTPSEKPFTVDHRSPAVEAGSVSAQSDKLFSLSLSGEVQAQELAVSYFPAEDAVCLQFRVDFVTYFLYWSRSGRETFLTALERYKFDYEVRDLNAKAGRREKRLYGTARGYLGWQVFRLSELAQGAVDVNLGYSFKGSSKNKTPYFTVTQNQAEYQNREQGGRRVVSATVPLYFTRAQADELAALFDQEFLMGLSGGGGAARAGVGVQSERMEEGGEVKTIEEAFFEGE